VERFQWRRQDLVVVGVLKGWGMGRGVLPHDTPPHGEGVVPLPRKFLV